MENLNTYFSSGVEGKRIMITGGTTGIGKATAKLLASLKARLLIFGRDENDLNAAVDDIRAAYPDAEIYGLAADVAYKQDIEWIFSMTDKYLGGLDVLINNAALPAKGISHSDYDACKYIVETNVLGYLGCAAEAIKRMTAAGGGHIINIGSMSAETKEATSTIYVATKSAIRGFTAALRKEANPLGIKVTLIEPGAVTSDMQPGTPKEHREKIAKMEMLEAGDIAMSILFCLVQHKRCDIVSLQVRPHLQLI
jgi:NADP-dependent 3-hydroxy acid dehydrogenase YdfG